MLVVKWFLRFRNFQNVLLNSVDQTCRDDHVVLIIYLIQMPITTFLFTLIFCWSIFWSFNIVLKLFNCFKIILFRNNYWYDTLACNMNCLSLKADFQLRKSIIGLLTEKVQAMYQSSFVFSHCLAETTIMQPFVSGICVIHQLMFGFWSLCVQTWL